MSVKVVLIKDKPIGQFVVESDITTIGRKSECDISIKDPAVSGSHAQIHKLGKNYVIEDLGSTNGVVYKGRKVKQQILKHDDLVSIGEHQLKFLITGGSVVETRPRTLVTPVHRSRLELNWLCWTGQTTAKKSASKTGLPPSVFLAFRLQQCLAGLKATLLSMSMVAKIRTGCRC